MKKVPYPRTKNLYQSNKYTSFKGISSRRLFSVKKINSQTVQSIKNVLAELNVIHVYTVLSFPSSTERKGGPTVMSLVLIV